MNGALRDTGSPLSDPHHDVRLRVVSLSLVSEQRSRLGLCMKLVLSRRSTVLARTCSQHLPWHSCSGPVQRAPARTVEPITGGSMGTNKRPRAPAYSPTRFDSCRTPAMR